MKGWLAVGLVVVAAFGIQEWRIRSLHEAQSAARDAQFKAALDAIDAQRTTVAQERAALASQQTALRVEIQKHKAALVALAATSAQAAARTETERVAADTLAAHPTWQGIQASAVRLRVTVRPVQR